MDLNGGERRSEIAMSARGNRVSRPPPAAQMIGWTSLLGKATNPTGTIAVELPGSAVQTIKAAKALTSAF